MMVWNILLTLLLATLLAGLITFGFRERMRPWSFWIVLVILFLAGVIIAAWTSPMAGMGGMGGVMYGFAWLPVVVGTLLIALMVLALAAPPGPGRGRFRSEEELEAEAAAGTWAFLWFLILALVVTALASFLR